MCNEDFLDFKISYNNFSKLLQKGILFFLSLPMDIKTQPYYLFIYVKENNNFSVFFCLFFLYYYYYCNKKHLRKISYVVIKSCNEISRKNYEEKFWNDIRLIWYHFKHLKAWFVQITRKKGEGMVFLLFHLLWQWIFPWIQS